MYPQPKIGINEAHCPNCLIVITLGLLSCSVELNRRDSFWEEEYLKHLSIIRTQSYYLKKQANMTLLTLHRAPMALQEQQQYENYRKQGLFVVPPERAVGSISYLFLSSLFLVFSYNSSVLSLFFA